MMENPVTRLAHNKPALYAVLLVSAVGVGWVVYRKAKGEPILGSASSSSSTATAPNAIDPLTGLPTSMDSQTDPQTGQTYLAEAQAYGSVAAADSQLGGLGLDNGGGSAGNQVPATQPNGTVSGSTNPPGSPYSSNAGWAQAVQAGLVDVGYDATTVGRAIGEFLTGTPLDAADEAIVKTAIAEFGQPPVGNLQVISAPAAGPYTPDPGPAPSVPAKVTAAPANVSVTPGNGGADIGWAPVPHAAAYQIRVEGPTNVTVPVGNVTATHVSLKPGAYHVNIRGGVSASDIHGPYSTSHDFTVAAGPHLVSK